jgi:3-oxoacyl-[acyl-carrier protein] reductase
VVALSAAELPEGKDDEHPLAGKVAVVTGAARGIGAAIAKVMARDGAHVVAVDIPAAGDTLAEVANEIGGTALQLDITAADAAERLIEHLRERHGGVDVVVHNAGITRDKLLVNMDAARWNSVMAVNLQAQLDITQALLDADGVLKPNARIVCVSSQSGIAGNRGQTNYAASKAGLVGLARSIARELGSRNITANVVAPGFVETDMTAELPEKRQQEILGQVPLGRYASTDEIAGVVRFLASDAAGYITGAVVPVDGGLGMGH